MTTGVCLSPVISPSDPMRQGIGQLASKNARALSGA
jgi:hypothetical protein